MKRLFAVFSLILMTSTFAAADVYVKTKNHTDPISMAGQSQPASDSVTEQWIGDGKVAVVSTTDTIIINTKENMMYIVNNKDKTYIAASLPLDYTKLLPPQMAGMMQAMKITATVTPTGNKKTIGERSCDEYDVALTMAMMPLTLKVCATTDLPFDYENYMTIQTNLLKSQMAGADDTTIEELGKIKGFWITQETTGEIMGAKIREYSEVIEISEKPAPAGIYTVPEGYTKKDTLSLEDMQNQ